MSNVWLILTNTMNYVGSCYDSIDTSNNPLFIVSPSIMNLPSNPRTIPTLSDCSQISNYPIYVTIHTPIHNNYSCSCPFTPSHTWIAYQIISKMDSYIEYHPNQHVDNCILSPSYPPHSAMATSIQEYSLQYLDSQYYVQIPHNHPYCNSTLISNEVVH